MAVERAWHPRDLFFEFLRPLRYGDSLTVQCQLTDLDADGGTWIYTCRKSGSGELCVRAQVEWVFLEAGSGRPTAIPRDLASHLRPADPPGQRVRHSRFPALPPRPPGAFSLPWEIQWRDVGPDLVLHTATCLDYLADLVSKAAAACGRGFTQDAHEGMVWVIRRQWLRCLEPLTLGCGLRFSTWLSDVKRVTVLRHFTIQRADDGAELGQAHTLWVCLDPQTGQPMRIPSSFLEGFAPQIAES
jgi:acyl-CoA thioester hydrolase